MLRPCQRLGPLAYRHTLLLLQARGPGEAANPTSAQGSKSMPAGRQLVHCRLAVQGTCHMWRAALTLATGCALGQRCGGLLVAPTGATGAGDLEGHGACSSTGPSRLGMQGVMKYRPDKSGRRGPRTHGMGTRHGTAWYCRMCCDAASCEGVAICSGGVRAPILLGGAAALEHW
jgi:hypothetical protein